MITFIGWMISIVSFGHLIAAGSTFKDYLTDDCCKGKKFLLGFVFVFLSLWLGTLACGVWLINWVG